MRSDGPEAIGDAEEAGESEGSDLSIEDAAGSHEGEATEEPPAEPAASTPDADGAPPGPRHLRASVPPTGEIVLDLERDGHVPTEADDSVEDDADGEPKVIGRHRKRRSRAPWLAAAAVAVAVTGMLIAIGAFGSGRGRLDAGPTPPASPTSTMDSAPVLLIPTDTPSPSVSASPSPSPSTSSSRVATPTATVTTAIGEPATTPPPPTSSAPPNPTATPTPAGPTVVPVPPHQLTITGAPGRCVDVNGGAFTNGNTVQSWSCNNSNAQKFSFTASGTLSGNGVCVAPAGIGTPANGTLVQVRTCGGPNQIWQFRSDKSIYNPSSGLCLNDPGSPASNRQLQLATCNGGTGGQRWTYS
jgi:hypothetical protein